MDTLALVLRNTRLAAAGTLGLTRPAPGSLEYTFSSPDLGTLAQLLAATGQVEPQVEGSVRAQGSIAGSLQQPEIVANVQGRALRYDAWKLGALGLDATLARGPTGWGGQLQLSADNAVLATGERFDAVRLNARGTRDLLSVGLSLRRDARAELALSGLLQLEGNTPRGVTLDSLAVRLEGTRWTLDQPAHLQWAGVHGLVVQNLTLRRSGEGGGLIHVDGQLPPTGNAELRVQVEKVDLADVRRLVGDNAPDVRGILSLDALFQGPVASPELTLRASVDSLGYQSTAADSLRLSATLNGSLLRANAGIWTGGRPLLVAEGSVPMHFSFSNLVPSFELLRTEPLAARLVADSVDLGLVTAAVPQLAAGSGRLDAQVVAAGTLAKPDLSGWARVSGGSVKVLPLGATYSAIRGQMSFENQLVRIDSLAVRSAGTASLTGTVHFQEGGPLLYLIGDFSSFRAMSVPDVATVQLSGRVAVSGALPAPTLTGTLTVEQSTITIPELEQQSSTVEITGLDIGQIGADTLTTPGFLPPVLSGLRVDGLEVSVGDAVWLESREARIQIGGDLIVYRTGEELRVSGVLQAVRGTYALQIGPLEREFDIVSGRVQFFGTGDFNPELDIVAANRVRTAEAETVRSDHGAGATSPAPCSTRASR